MTNFYSNSSAEVGYGVINMDNVADQSSSSSVGSEDDLAMNLLDGEEMNASMANFIGIHKM